jgi:hypothetical protein
MESQLDPKIAHQIKMAAKELLRAKRYDAQYNPVLYIPANLSAHHPDSGMSMADHEKEKEARKAQKSS